MARVNLRLVEGGGDPPDNTEMEERLRQVELSVARIDATLTATLPTLATKADLHKEINAQTWKFVTWMTGICFALVGAVYYIATF